MPRHQSLGSRSGQQAHLLSFLLALAAAGATACAPPDRGSAAAGWSLAAGTVNTTSVAWLDGTRTVHARSLTGRVIAIASGPGGGVIGLFDHRPAPSSAEPSPLALVHLASPRGGLQSMAPLSLPALDHTGALLLASDGLRYAAVAYQSRQRDDTPCPVLLVDVTAGQITPTSVPCHPHERLSSLALEMGDAAGERHGVIAYAGLADVREVGGLGRLAAVHLPSGTVLGALPLSGGSVDVRLSPARSGRGPLLHVLERSGGNGDLIPLPETGRLLTLDPLTLHVLHHVSLGGPATRFAASTDRPSIVLAAGDTIRSIDATSGATRWVSRLPGIAVAVELVGDQVYVASPEMPALWVLDVARGYRQPDRPLAGRPVSLARVD